jgi:transposase
LYILKCSVTAQVYKKMRYIKGLTAENVKMLTRIYRQSQHYQVRQRAHSILLSYEGYQIRELIEILGVSRNTIYNWFNNWEKSSLVGLYNETGRGRQPIFKPTEKEQIKVWVAETPKKLTVVQERVKKEWGIVVSKDTLKRVIKSLKMTWHRLRRGLGGQPDPEEYLLKKQELEQLQQQAQQGEIDLRYGDESGFCLTPYVPYAWQERGTTITLRSQRSRRLNVLGFFNRHNELTSYVFECNIDSEVVIACLDRFSNCLNQKTVLVLDKASIHYTKKLNQKEEQWREKGLTIFWLPTYSPQLNLIELLWQKIKYEWLDGAAYESWSQLVNSVETILKQVGTKYTINFA